MSDKEDKIIDKISKAIEKLDKDIADIGTLEVDDTNTGKDSKVRLWFAEHKALHEIKHILNEVGKYEKYDEKELEKVSKFFKDMTEN